jgi:hypothetical protein
VQYHSIATGTRTRWGISNQSLLTQGSGNINQLLLTLGRDNINQSINAYTRKGQYQSIPVHSRNGQYQSITAFYRKGQYQAIKADNINNFLLKLGWWTSMYFIGRGGPTENPASIFSHRWFTTNNSSDKRVITCLVEHKSPDSLKRVQGCPPAVGL